MDRLEQIKGHVHRYFVAVYGKGYIYKAPELFQNTVERWMLHVSAGDMEEAEREIAAIEEHFKGLADKV